MLSTRRTAILFMAAATTTGALRAAGFPDKVVKLIVPFPPGGNVDAVSRTIAPQFQKVLGGSVVIENKAGASGIIATEGVARSAPDGHTLLMVGSNHGINPALFAKLPYDTVKDFAPVGLIGTMPLLLVVPAEVPVRSLDELVRFSRQNPQALKFGITPGSTTHLATEMLIRNAGLTAIQVPYKGDGPTVTDLLGGHVNGYLGLVSVAGKYVREGRLRAIGVTSARRIEAMPDVPTLQEQGLADFEAASWNGLFAPAGTPLAVIDHLSAALAKTLADPGVRKALEALGLTVRAGGPAEANQYLASEIKRWSAIVEAANIPKS